MKSVKLTSSWSCRIVTGFVSVFGSCLMSLNSFKRLCSVSRSSPYLDSNASLKTSASTEKQSGKNSFQTLYSVREPIKRHGFNFWDFITCVIRCSSYSLIVLEHSVISLTALLLMPPSANILSINISKLVRRSISSWMVLSLHYWPVSKDCSKLLLSKTLVISWFCTMGYILRSDI